MAIRFFLLCFFVASSTILSIGQALTTSAWKLENPDNTTEILLFSGDYFTWTKHSTDKGAFLWTKGGKWRMDGKKMMLEYEFHTTTPDLVGTIESIQAKAKNQQLKLKKFGKWMAIEEATSPLTNPYLFSGRKRNGELQRRDTDRPRKTMKVLTDTRFQWIAYNTIVRAEKTANLL